VNSAIRTPRVVRWPGHVPVGAIAQQPVSGEDSFPALTPAAGVTFPSDAKLDSRTHWPALQSG